MVSPAIKDELLSRMGQLPLDMQRRVLDFADALVRTEPKGVSGEALAPIVGTLDEESARQMIEAIEEGCEQVDEGGW